MVCSVNVAIKEAEEMADRVIVEKIRGRHPTLEEINIWVQTNWADLLSSAAEVGELTKGWYTFTLASKHDVEQILNRNWFYGMIPILLKRWTPLFNANSEQMDTMAIWVQLLGLLLELWNLASLKDLGNAIGTYLEADFSYLKTQRRDAA